MDNEFKKIKLHRGSKAASIRPIKKRNKKKLLMILAITVVVVLFIVLGIVLPAKAIYSKARHTMQTGRELAYSLKSQDLKTADEKLKATQIQLTDLKRSYGGLGWVGWMPIVGAYYNDGMHTMNAGLELINAGQVALDAISPYADLLGFTSGQSSFVDQPADKRIETAVATFSQVTPKLTVISEHLEKAKKEIDFIDPKRYPAKVAGTSVRSNVQKAKKLADEGITFFVASRPLLELLPDLLGETEKQRYLVLFQNDKELRATGGFLTAYALIHFNKGHLTLEKSEDIYNLDEQQVKRVGAPEDIRKYHKGVFYFNLRDSNLSPDFAASMKQFEELYKNVSGSEKYNGIFAMDTHVLVEAMKVLDGEIFIPEYNAKFTVQPDSRCDGCPQVIYELEEYADKAVGYYRGERKDILGRLLFNMMQKSLSMSPSRYWGKLMQVFLDEVNQKHILAYMHDDTAQKAIEALNFGGRIKEFDADYLHINDTNFAGAKSNMFVKHFVKQDIEVAKDGSVVKTITIDYKNPSQPSNCGVGGLCLNGELRNWLRIYVPKGSTLVEFTGVDKEVGTETKEDLGKTVFNGFLTVRPLGSGHVVVKYQLPDKMSAKEYRLLIQKQPGTEGHEYTIAVNGKEMEKFNLTTDRELSYKL